jgi:hypothetical protein
VAKLSSDEARHGGGAAVSEVNDISKELSVPAQLKA